MTNDRRENRSGEASSGSVTAPVLVTRDLVLSTGVSIPNINIETGLTMLRVSREQSATVLSLTLAGRMKPRSGVVALRSGESDSAVESMKFRFKHVAIAGVPTIDSLERLVPVRSIIREQAAWSQPWYRRASSNVDKIDSFAVPAKEIGLEIDNERAKRTNVGQLSVLERLKLRTVLALMVRPECTMLIIDDVDQLRDLDLRDEFMKDLLVLSKELPIVVSSANPDFHAIADHVIDVTKESKKTSAVTTGESGKVA